MSKEMKWNNCSHGILYRDGEKVLCELCDIEAENLALKARIAELEAAIMEHKENVNKYCLQKQVNFGLWDKRLYSVLKEGE